MTLDELIVELERLDKERSEGPWRACVHSRSHKPSGIWDQSNEGYALSINHPGDEEEPSLNWRKGNEEFVIFIANALSTLLKVIKVQREVLKFYADPTHYIPCIETDDTGIVFEGIRAADDSGNKARQAISQTDAIVKEMG